VPYYVNEKKYSKECGLFIHNTFILPNFEGNGKKKEKDYLNKVSFGSFGVCRLFAYSFGM